MAAGTERSQVPLGPKPPTTSRGRTEREQAAQVRTGRNSRPQGRWTILGSDSRCSGTQRDSHAHTDSSIGHRSRPRLVSRYSNRPAPLRYSTRSKTPIPVRDASLRVSTACEMGSSCRHSP